MATRLLEAFVGIKLNSGNIHDYREDGVTRPVLRRDIEREQEGNKRER